MKNTPVALLLLSALAFAACKKEVPPPAAPSNTPPAATSSGNPLLAPVEYLGATATAKKNAEKTIETVSINRAIQAFSAAEGRFPKDLNELIGPDYLRQLPPPPNGMKYDYNATAGVVKIVPK